MADDVNRPCRYRSPRRQEQAEQTAGRIRDAAAALFRERGYDGASITAIAERAGVAAETVYARFGNKRTLLGDVVRAAVRGGDARPVLEQEGPRAVEAAPTAAEQVERFAADVTRRLARAAPLVAVVAEASRAEPEIAALYAALHAERRRNLVTFVAALDARGGLRLDPEAATRVVWTLASPEAFNLLTAVDGRTPEEFERWLADQLGRALLG